MDCFCSKLQTKKAKLVPLLILAAAAGCQTPKNVKTGTAAVRDYHDGAYRRAVARLEPLANKTDENYVLNNLRLGSAALAAYDLDEAEQAFLRAWEVINATGVNDGGRAAAATWIDEKIKIWKGEPYERAMASFYLGLVYYMRRDYDNARAAFENSLFKLRDYSKPNDKPADKQYTEQESTFTLALVMLGRAYQRVGRDDLAAANFARARELRPALGTLTDPAVHAGSNVLLVVDFGYGPRKTTEFDGSVLAFTPEPQQAGRIPTPVVFVDGRRAGGTDRTDRTDRRRPDDGSDDTGRHRDTGRSGRAVDRAAYSRDADPLDSDSFARDADADVSNVGRHDRAGDLDLDARDSDSFASDPLASDADADVSNAGGHDRAGGPDLDARDAVLPTGRTVTNVARTNAARRDDSAPRAAWDGTAEPLIDTVAMAQDRRWQSLDTVRAVKSGLGTGLIAGGAGYGLYRAGRGDFRGEDAAIVGGLILAGALLKATSQTDVRQWEMVPRTTFVLPLRLPPGAHDITVEFPQANGLRQTWRGLIAPATGDATYYFRMNRWLPGPFLYVPPGPSAAPAPLPPSTPSPSLPSSPSPAG